MKKEFKDLSGDSSVKEFKYTLYTFLVVLFFAAVFGGVGWYVGDPSATNDRCTQGENCSQSSGSGGHAAFLGGNSDEKSAGHAGFGEGASGHSGGGGE